MEIADRGGIAALSIRKLADALGVTPMAIYHHFRNKQAVVDCFFDAAVGDFRPERPPPGQWREWTVQAFLGMRRTFARHPSVVTLIGTWGPAGENAMLGMEVVLDVLLEAGLGKEEAVRTFYSLIGFTAGYVAIEAATLRQRSEGEIADPEEWRRQQRLRFESSPLPRFPRLVELAPELASFWTDDSFELCLRALVDGIAQPGRRR